MSQQLSKPIYHKLNQLLSNVADMSLKRRAKYIIEQLDLKPSEKVIDLGCGTGYYLFLLSNLPIKLKLTGFDFDKKALNEAKISLSGKNIKFVSGDLHKIPFKDNSFDKIVISEVLEHVKKDVVVLKEINRILKPEGILVISVPSLNYPFLWDPINFLLLRLFDTHIKSGFWSGIWNGHLRLYKLNDLMANIKKAGFKIETIKELTSFCLPFNHYLINITARLLYDVKISGKIANSLSKFKQAKKPIIIQLLFNFINSVDKLNEIFPQNQGVNIFVKAIKS